MSRRKRIDPRVIGSFVIGAIILIVGGLLFFGPGGLLAETRRYVIHFDSSVKGLNVGSPVRFRGVKIGQVRDINVRVRPSDFDFHIPVLIEIEPSRITAEGSRQSLLEALKTTVQGADPVLSLVDKGLRAQLQLDSLVTGQLYVNLDMHPDTPVQLSGYSSEYPELPSVSSSLEELTKTFEDLPLKQLADKLIRSAEGFEQLITSPGLHRALTGLDETTTQLNRLLAQLNRELPELVENFAVTLDQTQATVRRLDDRISSLSGDFSETLEATRHTVSHLDAQIDPLSQQLAGALRAFDQAAASTANAMDQVHQLSAQDSLLVERFSLTLQDVSRTAQSLRYLINELERDPQMLLRGRATGDAP